MEMDFLHSHSLASSAKNTAYFRFKLIANVTEKQLPIIDTALHLPHYELIDVTDIVIRHKVNSGEHLKLEENVAIIPRSGKNLDQILRFSDDLLQ